MNVFRKSISVLMSIVLVVGLMPLPAYADSFASASPASSIDVTDQASVSGEVSGTPEASDPVATADPPTPASFDSVSSTTPEQITSQESLTPPDFSSLESAHDYENDSDETWAYSWPEATEAGLSLTFDDDTLLEANFDYLEIRAAAADPDDPASGTLLARFTGSALAGKTIYLPYSAFVLRLTSDGSETEYGFKVANIQLGDCSDIPLSIPVESAILYESGELVLQVNDTPDPVKGTVRTTYDATEIEWRDYTFGTNAPYGLPVRAWYDDRALITSVSLNVPEGAVLAISRPQALLTGCENLESVNLAGLDTSSATSMKAMFCGCTSLRTVDLSTLDAASVYDATSMFEGCSSLASVQLPQRFGNNMEYLSYLFYQCNALESVDLSALRPWNIESESDVFIGCTSLEALTLGSSTRPSSSWNLPEGTWNLPATDTHAVLSYATTDEFVTAARAAFEAYDDDETNINDHAGTWRFAINEVSYATVDLPDWIALEDAQSHVYGETLTFQGETLVRDHDYTATLLSLTATGAPGEPVEPTASGVCFLRFTGIGERHGTQTRLIAIAGSNSLLRADVDATTELLYDADSAADPEAARPDPLNAVTLGGIALVKGTDFEAAYYRYNRSGALDLDSPLDSAPADLGRYQLRLAGIGNYEGQTSVDYAIVGPSANGAQLVYDDTDTAYWCAPLTFGSSPNLTIGPANSGLANGGMYYDSSTWTNYYNLLTGVTMRTTPFTAAYRTGTARYETLAEDSETGQLAPTSSVDLTCSLEPADAAGLVSSTFTVPPLTGTVQVYATFEAASTVDDDGTMRFFDSSVPDAYRLSLDLPEGVQFSGSLYGGSANGTRAAVTITPDDSRYSGAGLATSWSSFDYYYWPDQENPILLNVSDGTYVTSTTVTPVANPDATPRTLGGWVVNAGASYGVNVSLDAPSTLKVATTTATPRLLDSSTGIAVSGKGLYSSLAGINARIEMAVTNISQDDAIRANALAARFAADGAEVLGVYGIAFTHVSQGADGEEVRTGLSTNAKIADTVLAFPIDEAHADASVAVVRVESDEVELGTECSATSEGSSLVTSPAAASTYLLIAGDAKNAVPDFSNLESAHPYGNGVDESRTFAWPAAAETGMSITFSDDTLTESGCDYLSIYDDDGNRIVRCSGSALAGKTVYVPTSTVTILLSTDGSVTEYGYRVTAVRLGDFHDIEPGTYDDDDDDPDDPPYTPDPNPYYALLYADGTLVVQPTAISARPVSDDPGQTQTPVQTYTVEHRDYRQNVPWYNQRSQITSIEFTGGVSPTQLRDFTYNMPSLVSVDFSGLDATRVYDASDLCACSSKLEYVNCSGLAFSNMECMFDSCYTLKSVDFTNANTSNVTNMRGTFVNCNNLSSLDLSSLDVSNVTNTSDLFGNCHALASLELPDFSSGTLTNAGWMFDGCNSLQTLDLSSLNATNVTNVQCMFNNCTSLASLALPDFSSGKLTDVSHLFSGCTSLHSLDLASLNATNVTSARGMFQSCASLASLALPDFSSGKLTDASYLLYGCNNLRALDLSSFNAANVTTAQGMFNNCTSLASLELPDFSSGKLTDASYLFSGCTNLRALDLSSFDLSHATAENLFDNCYALASLTLGPAFRFSSDCGLPTSWNDDTRLETWVNIDPENIDDVVELTTEQLVSTYDGTRPGLYERPFAADSANADTAVAILYDDGEMIFQRGLEPDADKGAVVAKWTVPENGYHFYKPWDNYLMDWNDNTPGKIRFVSFKQEAHPLAPIWLDSWFGTYSLSEREVDGVMKTWYPSTLESIDFTNLDTSRVESVNGLFYNAAKLHTLNFGSATFPNIHDLSSMFYHCRSLTSLDLSALDLSNAYSFESMFSGCVSLTSLDISSFDMTEDDGAGTYADNLFADCDNLSELVLGEKFQFKGSNGSYNTALRPSGEKRWIGPNGLRMTTAVLELAYDGATMAGTWRLQDVEQTMYAVLRGTDLTIQFEEPPAPTEGDDYSFWKIPFDAAPTALPWNDIRADLTSVTFEGDVIPVTLTGWFAGCKNLRTADLTGIAPARTLDAAELFKDCASLVSVDFGNISFSDMTGMFQNCIALETVNLGQVSPAVPATDATAEPTPMTNLFAGCTSLRSLKLGSSWRFASDCALADQIDDQGNVVKWFDPRGHELASADLIATYDGSEDSHDYNNGSSQHDGMIGTWRRGAGHLATVHRLFGSENGNHYVWRYLSDETEIADLTASGSWHDQGIAWTAFIAGDIPVYEMRDEQGSDFWLVKGESQHQDYLSNGLIDCSVAFYTDAECAVPVFERRDDYGFYRPFYTTSEELADELLDDRGWMEFANLSWSVFSAGNDDADVDPYESGRLPVSGTWGDCPWSIDAAGVLTIGPGTGANYYAYDSNAAYPWTPYCLEITRVDAPVGPEGERIVLPSEAYGLFAGCVRAESFDLSGLDVSGAVTWSDALSSCRSTRSVTVPAGFLSSNNLLPSYTVDGHADWFSAATKTWFTYSEIASERAGLADTYTKSDPDAGSKKNVTEIDVALASGDTYAFTGQLIEPDVVLTDGDVTLERGVDYQVLYERNVLPGTARIAITGQGENYTGAAVKEFTIEAPQDIETVDVVRLYDPETAARIYARDTGIAAKLVADGWTSQGVAWRSPSYSPSAAFVLYDTEGAPYLQFGNADDIDSSLRNGSTFGGIAWFSDETGNGFPIYAAYSNHYWRSTVYSTDRDEIDALVATDRYYGGNQVSWATEAGMISDNDLSTADVAVEGAFVYDGSEKTPSPRVTYQGTELEKDVDYVVSYANNVDPGTATLTVTGIGLYRGTQNTTFTIEKSTPYVELLNQSGMLRAYGDTVTFDIATNSSAELTAKSSDESLATVAVQPAADDSDMAKLVVKPRCSGFVTLTVSVAESEWYADAQLDYTTTIYERSIADARGVVTNADELVYGSSAQPAFSLTLAADGEDVAVSASDYVVSGFAQQDPQTGSWRSLVSLKYAQAGTCVAYLDGVKNLTGWLTVEFTILPRSIDRGAVRLVGDSPVYTGSALTPLFDLTVDGILLKSGSDYITTYADNVDAGIASVTFDGIGNYCGTLHSTFGIEKAIPTLYIEREGGELYVGAPSTVCPIICDSDGELSLDVFSSAARAYLLGEGDSLAIVPESEGDASLVLTVAESANYTSASYKFSAPVTHMYKGVFAKVLNSVGEELDGSVLAVTEYDPTSVYPSDPAPASDTPAVPDPSGDSIGSGSAPSSDSSAGAQPAAPYRSAVLTVQDDAHVHEWGTWHVVQEATCEEAGLEQRACRLDASHVETRELPALGHAWSEWVVTREPSENTPGERTRVCERCNAGQGALFGDAGQSSSQAGGSASSSSGTGSDGGNGSGSSSGGSTGDLDSFTVRGNEMFEVDAYKTYRVTMTAAPEGYVPDGPRELFADGIGEMEIEFRPTPIEYEITFDLAGGTMSEPTTLTYTIESSEIAFPEPTCSGFLFEGWVDEDGNPIDALSAGSMGNRTFTATWLPLEPVENLRATFATSHSIGLAWDAFDSAQIAGYRVYRDGALTGDVKTATFVDTALEGDAAFTYDVRAYTTSGSEAPFATIEASLVTPRVTSLVTESGADTVNKKHHKLYASVPDDGNLTGIDGKTAQGAFAYRDENGDDHLIASTDPATDEQATTATIASWVDAGGMRTFKSDWDIAALAGGSYEVTFTLTDPDGTPASLMKIIELDRVKPAPVLDLVALGDVGKVVLSWSRASDYGSTYELHRTDPTTGLDETIATIDDIDTRTFTDRDVELGNEYRYYLVVIGANGEESEPSAIASASPKPDEELPVVTSLSPESGSVIAGTKRLSASASDNVGVVNMKLEASDDDGATWQALATSNRSSISCSLDTTSFADGPLQVRTTATDAAGNEGSRLASYRIDNTGPEQVTGLSWEATTTAVTLRWNDVADDDFSYFLVERLAANGTFTAYRYVYDTLGANLTGLAPNTTATYRVVAYDVRGNRGEPSEIVTATTLDDTAAPVVTALTPPPAHVSGTLDVTATVRDDAAVASVLFQLSCNGEMWDDLERVFPSSSTKRFDAKISIATDQLGEGLIYVRAIGTDEAGNVGDESSGAPFVQYLVDRTPPAVPADVVARPSSGVVEIAWAEGPEDDIAGYTVFRATADGSFEQLDSVYALNCWDRSVKPGVTYAYYVIARDAAGNASAASATVTATVPNDAQAPSVLSVGPANGSVVGPEAAGLSVLASDDLELACVTATCSIDGGEPLMVIDQQNIAYYYARVSGDLPIVEANDGSTLTVRVSCEDAAGQVSETVELTYTVDKSAPSVSAFAAVAGDDSVELAWTGAGEADLAGYRIYRQTDAGIFNLVGSRTAVEADIYTFSDPSVQPRHTYIYKVEAVDAVGNVSSALSDEITLAYEPRVEPDLSFEETQQVASDYVADASGTFVEAEGDATYMFDFGDGIVKSGMDTRVVHRYAATGTYTLTLTVTDSGNRSATATKQITVSEPQLVGTVTATVVDEAGAPLSGIPVYFDMNATSPRVKQTSFGGTASFVASAGTYVVGAYLDSYLPTTKSVVTRAGTDTQVTLVMIDQPVVTGEFDVDRMTLDEIVAAGIDVNDPANQQIVNLTIHLTYGTTPLTINALSDGEHVIHHTPITIGDRSLTPVIIPSGGGGGSGIGGGGGGSASVPIVALIDIPVKASYLKEFFDVKLHIMNNASPEFSLVGNTVDLNVPAGMTLMTSAIGCSPRHVAFSELAGMQQKTIEWILRGDDAGEYDLTADFQGTLTKFNTPVIARFETGKKINVYGKSAMKIIAEINSTIAYDALYFNLTLENKGGADMYLPAIDVVDNAIKVWQTKRTLRGDDEGDDPSSNFVESAVPTTLLGMVLANAQGFQQAVSTMPTALAQGASITKKYAAYGALRYDDIAYLRDAFYESADAYEAEIEIRVVDMNLFSYDDPIEQASYIKTSALDSLEYLYDTPMTNFYYFAQASANGHSALCQLGVNAYEFGDLIFRLNFGAFGDDEKRITREYIVKMLKDEAFASLVDSKVDQKYTKAVRDYLGNLSSTLSGSYADKDGADIVKSKVKSALGDTTKIKKLANSLRSQDSDAFFEQMWDAVLEDAAKTGSALAIKSLYEHSEFASDLGGAISSELGNINKVVGKLDSVFQAWNRAAELRGELMQISAAREEALALVDIILNYGGLDATVAEEVRSIRAGLVEGFDSQTDLFLKEIGNDIIESFGQAVVKKASGVLMKSFGFSSAGIAGAASVYAALKIAFEVLDAAFGWGDKVEAVKYLSVAAELTQALRRNINLLSSDPDTATRSLEALKYLVKMRIIGERTYIGIIEDDDRVSTLTKINSREGTHYSSLEAYFDAKEALVLWHRDQLFGTTPTTAMIPDAPSATLNLLDETATLTGDGHALEYSFDGENWSAYEGAIPLDPVNVPRHLWARAKATADNVAGNVSKTTVPARPRVTDDVHVQRVRMTYTVSGLAAGTYAYAFAKPAGLLKDASTFTVETGGTAQLTSADRAHTLYLARTASSDALFSQTRAVTVDEPFVVSLSTADAAKGSVSGGGEAAPGASVTVTATPAAGYAFDGWMEGGQVVVADATYTFTVDGNRSLVATWTPLTYTISYELGGVPLPDGVSLQVAYTVEDGVIALPVLTRTDRYDDVFSYAFDGWTGPGFDEPSTDAKIPVHSTGDRTFTAHWSIVPIDLANAKVVLAAGYESQLVYGSNVAPKFDVTIAVPGSTGEWNVPVDASNYVVSYFSDEQLTQSAKLDHAGVFYAKLTARGQYYTGSTSWRFEIARASLSSATVSGASTQTYTGSALELPDLMVRMNDVVLTAGQDYEVSYANNVNAGSGTASVTVSGIGNYQDQVVLPFTIAPRELTADMVSLEMGTVTFDGMPQEPAVTVEAADCVIAESDYAVQYAYNVNAGTASVTVTGGGNLSGSVMRAFKVEPADIAGANVSAADVVYANTPAKAQVVATFGGYQLVEGKDFAVTYANNDGPGDATATLSGRGNFTGSTSVQFTIVAPAPSVEVKNLAEANVTLSGGPFTYTGTAYKPALLLDGQPLSAADFDVTYANNVNAGTAVAVVVAKTSNEEYVGAKVLTFPIACASIADAAVEIIGGPFDYTGAEVEPAVRVTSGNGAVELVRGVDYVLGFRNNRDASTQANPAQVTVTGIGNYTGIATATFEISAISAERVDVAFQALSANLFYYKAPGTYYYTGAPITPPVDVAFNGAELAVGTDYDVAITTNAGAKATGAVGTYKMLLTFKGRFAGTRELTFKIVQSSVGYIELVDALPSNGVIQAALRAAIADDATEEEMARYEEITDQIAAIDRYYLWLTSAQRRKVPASTLLKIASAKDAIDAVLDEDEPAAVDAVSLSDVTFGVSAVGGSLSALQEDVSGSGDLALKVVRVESAAGNYQEYDEYTTAADDVKGVFEVELDVVDNSGTSVAVSDEVKDSLSENLDNMKLTLPVGPAEQVAGKPVRVVHLHEGASGLTEEFVYGAVADDEGNATVRINQLSTFIVTVQDANEFSDEAIGAIEAVEYDGGEHEPAAVVTFASSGGEPTTLVEGNDYVVEYADNVNVPAAGAEALPRVTVRALPGSGYYGTATRVFEITPKSIENDDTELVLSATEFKDNDAVKAPTVSLQTILRGVDTPLVEGRDYTIAGFGDTSVGVHTLTITGKGNYAGIRAAQFTITPASIDDENNNNNSGASANNNSNTNSNTSTSTNNNTGQKTNNGAARDANTSASSGSNSSNGSKSSGASGNSSAQTGNENASSVASAPKEAKVSVGTTVTYKGLKYRVTNMKKAAVSLKSVPKAKKSVTIPATIKVDGKSYKVTGIAKNAFKGSKVKKVNIKTKKLTKKSVKGCFKGAKSLRTVKVPPAKRAAYKAFLTKKVTGCKVTISR